MTVRKTKFKKAVTLISLCALTLTLARCTKSQVAPGTNDSISAKSGQSLTSLSSTPTYNITSCLPAGYVKDGSKDYTTYIQAALNKNSNVTFPGFPIMIDDAGLLISSNANITFLAGSQLILKPTASGDYSVIRIQKVSNVTLTNPVIIGDKTRHLATSGEWGQGIDITAASNVTINGANVTNCWGDGIYLASKSGVDNKNITITNAYCQNNRRNQISVTDVVGLVLNSPYAGYSNGIAPFTGIDFEPNYDTDQLQNIVVNNAQTEHNSSYGISIGLRNLYGGSNKTIGLTFNNSYDKESAVAYNITSSLTHQVGNETVSGPISINSPTMRENSVSPIQTTLVNTVKLAISKPSVENMSGALLSQASILSLFEYKTNINQGANYSITF